MTRHKVRARRSGDQAGADEQMPMSPPLDVPALGDLFGVSEYVAVALTTCDGFPRPTFDGKRWGWDGAAVVGWARDRGIPRFST